MIKELIQKGESKTVEFKEKLPQNHQIAKTVCAFSNRAGGYILIGVKDNGQICGLKEDEITEHLESIPNIIHDSIYPMLIPELYTYTIDGNKIVVIQVFPGSSTPYYLKQKGKFQGTYVRVGRTNKLADQELLQELERRKINKSFEEDIYGEASEQDISSLKKILENNMDKEITLEKLKNLHLIEAVGDIVYLTNAGAILQGQLTNCLIRCARFEGASIIDFIDKKEFSGDVFMIMDLALSFIKNHINMAGIIKGNGLKRKDVQEIPDEVLREGIINAIVHRDYSISGSDIKIAIYNSKIEIISPGGLPKTITIEEIYAGRSEIRNKILAKILMKSGLIEQWGSGIPRMREMCKQMNLQEPELVEDGLFVKLVIYREQSQLVVGGNKEKIIISRKSLQIEAEKKTIYEIILSNENITTNTLAQQLVMSVASVQRRLDALQREKKIARIGSKKTGCWKAL